MAAVVVIKAKNCPKMNNGGRSITLAMVPITNPIMEMRTDRMVLVMIVIREVRRLACWNSTKVDENFHWGTK